MAKQHKQRDRKDHHTPQGYLRGFIDPARCDCEQPLWHLDLESKQWSEKSPREVGWKRGLYDYAPGTTGLEHPDEIFAKYEREFPLVREKMLQRKYKGWTKQQKPFLLAYMQMMRARSPIFLNQQTEINRSQRGATVTGVGPGNQITLDSLELRPFSENVVRNATISQMRQEIANGPAWMIDFNWCLLYTTSPAESFVTGPHPITLESPAPDIVSAMKHPATLIWFPLCWQACLLGRLLRFEKGTDVVAPCEIAYVRELFRRPSTGYLIAAQPFPL